MGRKISKNHGQTSLAIFEGVLRVADLGLRRLGDVDADGNAKGGMVTDGSLDDEDFD